MTLWAHPINAVVAVAFAPSDEDTDPKAGIRPTENLEADDVFEALDPGRKGEGCMVAWWGMDPTG